MTPELNSGLRLYKMGLLQEAEQVFQIFLRKHPTHAEALHFCGLTVHAQGRHLEAARLIERTIARDSGRATFHINLALWLAIYRNALNRSLTRQAFEWTTRRVGLSAGLIMLINFTV